MTLVLNTYSFAALSSTSDESLVTLARRGSDEAFDELIKRHAPRLHAVVSRIVGREEAHDVVQDAFLNAYRALPKFRAEAQFTTWLHRIALNCAYARTRRVAGQPLELSEQTPSAVAEPWDSTERRALRDALERALSKINAEFRETFVLAEFGELDHAQIAQILGIAPGTVKSRMSRARAALRAILEQEGYHP